MADLATLQLWLLEAKTALHKLKIGRMEASVSYDGKSVSYTQADMAKLQTYINDLEKQIATLTGQPRRRGPMLLGF